MSQKQGRQMQPLSEKLTKEQQDRRMERIIRRRGMAQMSGMLVQVLQLLNRGFFGRMNWLLFGR